MYCGNCGTKIDDNAAFCNNCGQRNDSPSVPKYPNPFLSTAY
ncbi:MAG: zinc ribbon domain-containing protein [Clostridia bacterium]|nr:zinc ribbon domain-containing protein [Clostridia bacterium]